ncbi:MAG: isoprenylcysteine carboxylmethyltransferase family protein [Gemmatimonadota bacterium]|nr:isoprenylcysteine carboxylmethyltransferase family protein [Gemmatimonadota bacterium]HEU4988290.1 isoprenylcysteine carboxylmethyltransferase family protein [Gemmatimonadaceae bacterium]
MTLTPAAVLRDLWFFIVAVWLLAAIRTKPVARRQPLPGQLVHRVVTIAGYVLVFSGVVSFGPLGWRFVKPSVDVRWTGVAITALGIAVMLWARATLAGNWSANVTVKESHELVIRGPYAWVRHPIYSGITLATIGTALAEGEVRALVGVVLVVIGWRLKWGVEERFMTEQFGDQYRAYMGRVRALIPGVW